MRKIFCTSCFIPGIFIISGIPQERSYGRHLLMRSLKENSMQKWSAIIRQHLQPFYSKLRCNIRTVSAISMLCSLFIIKADILQKAIIALISQKMFMSGPVFLGYRLISRTAQMKISDNASSFFCTPLSLEYIRRDLPQRIFVHLIGHNH